MFTRLDLSAPRRPETCGRLGQQKNNDKNGGSEGSKAIRETRGSAVSSPRAHLGFGQHRPMFIRFGRSSSANLGLPKAPGRGCAPNNPGSYWVVPCFGKLEKAMFKISIIDNLPRGASASISDSGARGLFVGFP